LTSARNWYVIAPMSDRVKVAAVQMTSTPDVEHNLNRALSLSREAAEDGAKLVVLPECVAHLGPGKSKLAHAEFLPEGGAILDRFAEFASTQRVDLIIGGFWEKADADHVYNTSVHLGPDGAVKAAYRKIHLFDVDLPDGTRLRESDTMLAGNAPVITETCVGTLGMSICYDVRFPELYRRLVDQGATVLTVPAAFTLTTGKDHWHLLLRARAIEAQCYVIAAAQTGLHFGDRRSYGHALICDPWGTVIAECGEGEGLAIGYVDPTVTAKVRAALPSLKHRRL
jgi:predicted amidohydrolase